MSVLNKIVDSALIKIRRMPFYYQRYNNTLAFNVNRAYTKYAKECSEAYRAQGGKALPPSPMFTNAAQCIRGAFPQEKAIAYSQKITNMIEGNDPAVNRPKGFSDLQIRITDPLQSVGADLLDVLRNGEVNDALMSFFQGNYRIQWVSVYRTIPAQRAASSWLWHSDSYPPHTCKVFLHLTPATAALGATEFMNLEDTMAYRKAGYFGQFLDERYADLQEFAKDHGIPYRPFHFDAAPGDASIFDQNFFHRAVSPHEGFRDVVQLYMLPNAISWEEQLQRDGIQNLSHLPGGGYPNDPRPSARGSVQNGSMM